MVDDSNIIVVFLAVLNIAKKAKPACSGDSNVYIYWQAAAKAFNPYIRVSYSQTLFTILICMEQEWFPLYQKF